MENSYRVASHEEREAINGHSCDQSYSLLLGPNGFECLLTEPEDRNWHRDGKAVVDELNMLYQENIRLRQLCLQDLERRVKKVLNEADA